MESIEINNRLLTAKQAAAYLAISERTLWNLTSEHRIPSVKIGRSVRYDVSDLDAFIAKAKRQRV